MGYLVPKCFGIRFCESLSATFIIKPHILRQLKWLTALFFVPNNIILKIFFAKIRQAPAFLGPFREGKRNVHV